MVGRKAKLDCCERSFVSVKYPPEILGYLPASHADRTKEVTQEKDGVEVAISVCAMHKVAVPEINLGPSIRFDFQAFVGLVVGEGVAGL